MRLNPTAVELAEISLWLDTMTSQLKAPWFGLHLRRGNSLVGALRATYSTAQLKKKGWLTAVPRREPVQHLAEAIDAGEPKDANAAGRIHQFLLPSATRGAAAEAKDLKTLAADEIKAMKAWRKDIGKAPTNEQTKKLANLATRVETLWAITLSKMRIAEDQIRREQIEQELLSDAPGAYLSLRLVMDAWNALTFWPLTEVDALPDLDEWLATLADELGTDITSRDAAQTQLGKATNWGELTTMEHADIELSGARTIDTVLTNHPWLGVVQQVAAEQGFFHWDLDFAAVFACGGFDLQVGNPPWVRPTADLDALYSESDPWFILAHKPTQAAKNGRWGGLEERSRGARGGLPGARRSYSHVRRAFRRHPLSPPRRPAAGSLPRLHRADAGQRVAEWRYLAHPPRVPLHRKEGRSPATWCVPAAATALAVRQ